MASNRLLLASVAVATATLALGFALQRLWPWMAAVLLVGLAWFAERLLSRCSAVRGRRQKDATPGPCRPRGWTWFPSVGLFLLALAASAALLLEVGRGWALAGLVAALSAWDLAGFLHKLECVERVGRPGDLERLHLLRLLTVVVVGSGLAVLAMNVRLSLGFGLVLLLACLGMLALIRVVHLLSQRAG